MIKPLHDYIVVEKPLTAEKIGGIYIPDNSIEQSCVATVLAVGNGKRNKQGVLEKINVEVGEKVLIGKFTGQEIILKDKQKITLIKEENIISKFIG